MKSNPFINSDSNLRYYSYNYYLKQKYHQKIAKVPLDAGFICPNRDGKLAFGGCKFCSKSGSGDFVKDNSLELMKQFDTGLSQMREKWPNALGIAYFQAYSNTYDSLDRLKKLFEPFAYRDDVIEISIATRFDCLEDEKIEYLSNLNKIKPITLEIGIQSIHDRTTDAMNCCHHFSDFLPVYEKLKKANLRVTIHIINGLPYETSDMMIDTAKEIAKIHPDGIKIHMLNVLKDSYLYDEYQVTPFHILEKDEYIDIVVKQLEVLPNDVVIERLTGDGMADNLFLPEWIKKKTIVLNDISKKQKELNSYQGKYYETREH